MVMDFTTRDSFRIFVCWCNDSVSYVENAKHCWKGTSLLLTGTLLCVGMKSVHRESLHANMHIHPCDIFVIRGRATLSVSPWSNINKNHSACAIDKLAETCAACKEPITETIVVALKRNWHPHCLVCSHCGDAIVNYGKVCCCATIYNEIGLLT